jgi:hypothetical protein
LFVETAQMPLAEGWGIPDDIMRCDCVAKGTDSELKGLRAMASLNRDTLDALEAWLSGPESTSLEPSLEYVTFTCLTMAYARSKVGAVMVLDDAFMSANVPTIVRLASRAHIPIAYGWKALAKEGVLLSYATQSAELFQRAAGYVDKILKGASPASLPVERPTRFELVINLKIANILGLTIPESVILQADEVIR